MVVAPSPETDKRELRLRLLAGRAQRSPASRAAAADALSARILALPEVSPATTVACYLSSPEEPGTAVLLARLVGDGCTVLLPILEPDWDLTWATYRPGAVHTTPRGLIEPRGRPLGIEAVGDAAILICPALAADERGHRLGRGGGCYDRVLARLDPSRLRVALIYDDEVLDAVPTDAHDKTVHVIVTPERTLRVARTDLLDQDG